jgi:electron transfer flavoprotein alpha subunit
MALLLIADHSQNYLTPSTTATLTAAKQFSVPIHLIILGHSCHAAAEDAASYEGVSKVWVVDHPALARPLAEDITETLLALAKEYDFILAPSSTFGKNILPRLAALLDVAQVSDVTAILDRQTFVRPLYAGNILATLRSEEKIQAMTIHAVAFDHAQKGLGQAPIEAYPFKYSSTSRPTVVKTEKSSLEKPDLASAAIVIAAGRGVQTKENFVLLEELANELGAAIGAAKGAVDLGLISPTYQIGQTGKVVAPDLYMALGISGAIQHLTGMKESKVIVAINRDPHASIFQIADYGLVGDLTIILPELVEKIKGMKKQ